MELIAKLLHYRNRARYHKTFTMLPPINGGGVRAPAAKTNSSTNS